MKTLFVLLLFSFNSVIFSQEYPLVAGEVIIHVINNSSNLNVISQMNLVSDLCWDQNHNLTNDYLGGQPSIQPTGNDFVFDEAWDPNPQSTNTNFGLGLYQFSIWVSNGNSPLIMRSFTIDYRTSDLPGNPIKFTDLNIDFDVTNLSFYYASTRIPFQSTTIWNEFPDPPHQILNIKTGLQPLPSPTNLNQIETRANHPVHLQWTHPSNDINGDFRTGYNIYRKLSSQSDFSLAGTVSKETDNFIDAGILYGGAGTVYYNVRAIKGSTLSEPTNSITVRIVAMDKKISQSEKIIDCQISNYPNPFNPSTKIKYSLPEQSYIEIKIYDIMGREVDRLFSGTKEKGEYEIEFNARNLSSGIYLYSIRTNKFTAIKKMLLLK